MSDSVASLLPSTVPSVVIHTSTFDVGVGLVMAMVLEPVFIGVGGLSSVVSSNDAGVADCADRIWIEVPVLLRFSVTEASAVGCGSCRMSPTPFLKLGKGTASLQLSVDHPVAGLPSIAWLA